MEILLPCFWGIHPEVGLLEDRIPSVFVSLRWQKVRRHRGVLKSTLGSPVPLPPPIPLSLLLGALEGPLGETNGDGCT